MTLLHTPAPAEGRVELDPALGFVEPAQRILDNFGAKFFPPGEKAIYDADPDNLYQFTAYHGNHTLELSTWQSLCVLDEAGEWANWHSGPGKRRTQRFGVLMEGYRPPSRAVQIAGQGTTLPYVNGCSTQQLFPPVRLGDPTLQYLRIPAGSEEQAHHIHSTVRVVHILEGHGTCIVGMEGNQVAVRLVPGTTLILEPMCPHHFDTIGQNQPLVCIPFHVFSSSGAAEFNHPMFNGTYLMNQGA